MGTSRPTATGHERCAARVRRGTYPWGRCEGVSRKGEGTRPRGAAKGRRNTGKEDRRKIGMYNHLQNRYTSFRLLLGAMPNRCFVLLRDGTAPTALFDGNAPFWPFVSATNGLKLHEYTRLNCSFSADSRCHLLCLQSAEACQRRGGLSVGGKNCRTLCSLYRIR